MGTYGTGLAVRTEDDTHPMAESVGFITCEAGGETPDGDVIPEGCCVVEFVQEDSQSVVRDVLPVDDLRVVGC